MTATVDRTDFRMWFETCLGCLRGRKLEWPQLLRYILARKVEEVRSSEIYYKGDVFIDRDSKTEEARLVTRTSEKILVRQLYGLVHERQGGLLRLGEEDIWLITWETPNQGGEQSNDTKGRRVDLLGVRQDGSLVVFECKAGQNTSDSPLYALLEGLDYLGCLLTARNMTKLTEGFRKWRDKPRSDTGEAFMSRVPPAFREIEIRPDRCHKVVVLAPAEYYQSHQHDSTRLPQDWWYLSDRCWNGRVLADKEEGLELDFAVTEFNVPMCELLPLPRLETGATP